MRNAIIFAWVLRWVRKVSNLISRQLPISFVSLIRWVVLVAFFIGLHYYCRLTLHKVDSVTFNVIVDAFVHRAKVYIIRVLLLHLCVLDIDLCMQIWRCNWVRHESFEIMLLIILLLFKLGVQSLRWFHLKFRSSSKVRLCLITQLLKVLISIFKLRWGDCIFCVSFPA